MPKKQRVRIGNRTSNICFYYSMRTLFERCFPAAFAVLENNKGASEK